jgi:hypothetical protein
MKQNHRYQESLNLLGLHEVTEISSQLLSIQFVASTLRNTGLAHGILSMQAPHMAMTGSVSALFHSLTL